MKLNRELQLLIATVMIMAVTSVIVPPLLAQSQNITIRTADATIGAGETIDVPVEILMNGSTESVAAVKVVLTYDSTVLSASDCTSGSGFTIVCNADSAGEVQFVGINPSGVTSDAAPATITFTAVGESGASTDLAMSSIGLADLFGTYLTNLQFVNGQITIAGGAEVTRTPSTPAPVPTQVTPTPLPPTLVPPTPNTSPTPPPPTLGPPPQMSTSTPTPTPFDMLGPPLQLLPTPEQTSTDAEQSDADEAQGQSVSQEDNSSLSSQQSDPPSVFVPLFAR